MLNRRAFVGSLAAMTVAGTFPQAARGDSNVKERDPLEVMPLGIITRITDPEKDIARVCELGFITSQLTVSDYSLDWARKVRSALEKNNKPTSLICMGPGKYVWDFYEGPVTIGLVPREQRIERVERLKQGADFCREAGIPAVHAHFGFIPENPNDILYKEFIEVMKTVAGYAGDRGVAVYFETGQETPVTLLRAILDIGSGNLGINYDTANLIMYGKANPVDGLDTVGPFVRSLHAKDGLYPTNPRELGPEVPIGEGKVDFPRVIRKLKDLNFKGHITIEREISGPKMVEDILKAKKYLEDIIRTV